MNWKRIILGGLSGTMSSSNTKCITLQAGSAPDPDSRLFPPADRVAHSLERLRNYWDFNPDPC